MAGQLRLGECLAIIIELPPMEGGAMLKRRGALRRDGNFMRLQPLLKGDRYVPEHSRVELHEHRSVVAHQ